MLPDRGEYTAQVMASKAFLRGSRADDRPQSRIVGVRDIREQMMLDLVVEAAGKPGDEARAGGEVRGRADLVQGPIVSGANASKLHSGSEMGKLKYDRQQPAQHDVKDDERGNCPCQWQEQEGRQNEQGHVQALAEEQLGLSAPSQATACALLRRPVARQWKSFQNSHSRVFKL